MKSASLKILKSSDPDDEIVLSCMDRAIERRLLTPARLAAGLGVLLLDIEQGEFVAVMGPSGCGKSTLLNIVGLIDELNVYENVELPLLYQKFPKAQRKTLVREALELVGLSPRAWHKPEQLSGGQQQRVAVARAVVGDPKLILADEPTGNLDSKNGEEVMEMLTTLNEQGATILMVTHSPSHAERAHRIVNLLDGRIVPANELQI